MALCLPSHRISFAFGVALLALLLLTPVSRAQEAPTWPASRQNDAPRLIGPHPAPDTTNQWYSAQLHVHSWSNHNGFTQPGSVQLHSNWAANAGLDVIWWTDHNPAFTQTADATTSFSQATLDQATLNVAIPLPPNTPAWAVYNFVTKLKATVSAGQAAASLNNGLLRMEMQANADQTFDRFEYQTLTTDDLRIQGLSFTRPLASDPVLSFDAARCDPTGADAYAQVRVALSWHNYGQAAAQSLVYRLVPANQPAAIIASSTLVTVTVPLTSNHVELPLLEHAGLLPDGDDNAIQEMFFTVGARAGVRSCMELGNFTIHSRAPTTAYLVQALKDTAARNSLTYGVQEVSSWEQFSAERHLNPYLPSDAALLPGLNDIPVQQFVPLIHSYDGLVMLNHPFGAGYGTALPAADQEERVQSALSTLLPVNAWDMDMLEIYPLRGRVDLHHHLRLWDLLGVNGIQLCATMTSDAHGGPFTLNHAKVTWINAPTPSQDDLLAGMRACRVFFGDLSLYDGVVDLHLGATPMGSVFPLTSGIQPLQITIDPLPAGAQVKLVQQLLQPGTELTYLVDHAVVDPSQPVMLDVSQPSQVRVELWSATNQPLAFSNRIIINTLQCDVNSSGAVDIADVQTVAHAFGNTVPPTSAALDLRVDGRIDLWDVLAAAECWATQHAP